jgi:hypothetical protein
MESDDSEQKMKKEFEKLRDKYSLPSFDTLAEEFDAEKVFEKDSGFLLRDIRRAIAEKIGAYVHMLESLINPVSTPLFIYSVLKTCSPEQKNNLKKLYDELSGFQFKIMKLDTLYKEEAESEFIKQATKKWQGLKKEIYEVLDCFDKEYGKSSEHANKSYFG